MTDGILWQSSYSHEIGVAIERVDISDWLTHLGNAEFQRCCPPDHIACGFIHTDDVRPRSVNRPVFAHPAICGGGVRGAFVPAGLGVRCLPAESRRAHAKDRDLDAFGRADQRGKLPACQLRDVESDRCVA